MKYLISIFILLTLILPSCSHGEQVGNLLPINKQKWNEVVFLEDNSLSDKKKAVFFNIENDSLYGPCLIIGPWRAGQWSARFQFAENLNSTKGTLRGKYKTVNLKPFEASIYISYYKSDVRIMRDDLSLPPSEDWTSFEVVVRNPPPGAESISPGFGLSNKTEGKVYFANITFDKDIPEIAFPEKLPNITRKNPSKKFSKGKFFRIEQDSKKVWWLVSPEGKPFYSIGTVGPKFEDNERGYMQGRQYLSLLDSIGFNSLAGWTNLRCWAGLNNILKKGGNNAFPIFYTIETSKLSGDFDYLFDSQGKICGGNEHGFPDPFDPRFVEAYHADVAQIAEIVREKEWFIGWFADNERDHTSLYRCIYSKHAGIEFLKWLENRYSSIDNLNTAWGTNFHSIGEILSGRNIPLPGQGKMYDDYYQFSQVLVKHYIDVTLGVIRKEDPNHLVFSNRFMIADSSEWLSMLNLYRSFDGIAINLYPSNRNAGLSMNEKMLLKMVNDITEKPLIISEWSIPSLDSGLYTDPNNLDWSFNKAVFNQTERARQAALIAIDFYNRPYIVGSHWFTWKDFDSDDRKANRGIVKADGKDWVELQQALKKAHKKLR